MKTAPVVRDVVLLGGGHSHVIVIRKWAMQPISGVRLTLISEDAMTPYSGMLPGLVAGHYSYDESHIDLNRLCRWSRVRFIESTVTGIDPDTQRVELAGRPAMGYDLVSIDTGGAPKLDTVEGAGQYTTPVKPVAGFWARWQEIEARAEAADRPLRIGVVGGGAGGFEILMAMEHRLAQTCPDQAHQFFWLFRSQMLKGSTERVRRLATAACAERGIEVHGGFDVSQVDASGVHSADGHFLGLDEVLWCTEATAAQWPRSSGLDTDERGFITLDDTLRSTSHPTVFAAGDVAVQVNHPRPRAGVFAVRQGPALFENLQRAVLDRSLRTYRPQRHFLTLLSLGRQTAIARRGPLSIQGDWVWRWKDWIDRRFMDRFNALPIQPHMTDGELSGVLAAQLGEDPDQMRCGGCGAKVPGDVLADALAKLDVSEASGIQRGLREGDDVALLALESGLLAQTVDQLRSLVEDPWLFARIATLHALSDLFAAGARPHSALLTLGMAHARDAVTARELGLVLDGVMRELDAAHCALVGGHTSEAAELTVGLTVNGTVAGARADLPDLNADEYALILTKPLGIGVIMAADMAGRASWQTVAPCLTQMTRSNAAAADVFRDFSAVRCTDVTGFGLVGHLYNMLKSDTGQVGLTLDSLPVLSGATELVEQGVRSSLYRSNFASKRYLDQASLDATSESDPRFSLLFDPQTSGGLLVLVPADRGDACCKSLHAAGDTYAAQIGAMIPGSRGGSSSLSISLRR